VASARYEMWVFGCCCDFDILKKFQVKNERERRREERKGEVFSLARLIRDSTSARDYEKQRVVCFDLDGREPKTCFL
jgi:hypothetical protein